ncbi:alpha/beta hydrolase [Microbacterium sp. 1P10UB]|uniref:alpha/beta fold hydrolase n=1 Tax=unclassified Microbacterium TaxID=2609290 RepID=UPI0039A09A1B
MTAPACTVFFLPGLGLDAAAALPLIAELDARFRVIGIDLPGQGGSEDAPDGSVDAQVDAAVAVIERDADGGPWLLCAHSMGGKIAARIAQRVRDGEVAAFGLMGLVLLAPSPPRPEPLPDEKRVEMLSWVADGPISEDDARTFVQDNVGASLPEVWERDVVDTVRTMSPVAWRRWLEQGSKEDLAASIGVLDLPCVVLGGDADELLGASAQPTLLADVYPRARFVTLPGAGHLLSYERPEAVAAAISEIWEGIEEQRAPVPAEWGRLIASPRTTPRVRSTLARRALADAPDYEPRALTRTQLDLLRSIADRLVPQPDSGRVDIAARVDAELAAGGGDGWRPTDALSDDEAYRQGLDDLAASWDEDPDAALEAVLAGEGVAGGAGDGESLRRWFQDVRVDLTREWLIHPASLARIGYDGFATGAEDVAFAGYRTLKAGVRDDWEPSDLGRPAPHEQTGSDA